MYGDHPYYNSFFPYIPTTRPLTISVNIPKPDYGVTIVILDSDFNITIKRNQELPKDV